MSNKKIECAMLFQNTIETKGIAVGQSMEEIKKEVEYKNEKVQVVLQFPETPEETAEIEREVKEIKEILKRELRRQMQNRKEVVYHEESADVIESKLQSAVGSGW